MNPRIANLGITPEEAGQYFLAQRKEQMGGIGLGFAKFKATEVGAVMSSSARLLDSKPVPRFTGPCIGFA